MDKVESILDDFADSERADPRQRRNAASACATLGGEACVERLVRLAVSDPDNDVRKHASRNILKLPREEWEHLEDSIASHFHDTKDEPAGEEKDSGLEEEKLAQEVRKEKRELADVLGCLYHRGLRIPKISRGFFDRVRLAWYAHSSGMMAYVDQPRATMFKFSASTAIQGALLLFFFVLLAEFKWLPQTANDHQWWFFMKVTLVSLGVIFLSGMRIAPNWKLRNRPATWVLVDVLKTAIIGGGGAGAILAALLEFRSLIDGHWFLPSIVVTVSVVAVTRIGSILAYDLDWRVVRRNFIVRGLIGGSVGLLLVFTLIRFIPGSHDYFKFNLTAALVYSVGLGVIFSRVDSVGPREKSKIASKFLRFFFTFTVAACLVFLGAALITRDRRKALEFPAGPLMLQLSEDSTPENPTPENPTPENPTPENPTPDDSTPKAPTHVLKGKIPLDRQIGLTIDHIDPSGDGEIPLTVTVTVEDLDPKHVITIYQKGEPPVRSEIHPYAWTIVLPGGEVSFRVGNRYSPLADEFYRRLGGRVREELRDVSIKLEKPGNGKDGE